MSDNPINPYSAEGQGLGPRRQRSASVQLRATGEDGADVGTLMDPATRSLADALRITYRVLQLGMVALVVVFLFSGVRSVESNQKGVRLFLGGIENDDLPPGIQFTLPAPFGELVTVPAGVETFKLDSEYWPGGDTARGKSPEELKNSPRGKLDPATDGSIITADGSLAHARFTVTYRRDRVKDYLTSVGSHQQAERMVQAAVMRGVMHASAGVSIDEFLSDRADATRPTGTYADVATTAKAVAQRTLDEMQSGIVLQDLSIQDRTPPIDVIKAFEKVAEEDGKATLRRNQADEERAKILAKAAGQNAADILALIDAFDAALGTSDDDAAAASLAKIDAFLDGEAVRIGDREVQGIGGEASAILNGAREFRSSVVSRAQADAALFKVKLESFKQNPSVMVTGEWTEALRAFLGREYVEVVMLPPGTRTLEIAINNDPMVRREHAIRRSRLEAERKAKEDIKMMEDRKFSTEKPPMELSGS